MRGNALIIGMVVLAVSIGAQAALDDTITLTWTLEQNVGSANCPCNENIALDRYIVTVSADTAINGIDAGGNESALATGFSDCNEQEPDYLDVSPCGPGSDTSRIFHQYWGSSMGDVKTPRLEIIAACSTEAALDTHWLLDDACLVVVGALDEDNDKTCNVSGPCSLNQGWGTYLVGLFGLEEGCQATSIDIAQLVVPAGQLPHMDIIVSSVRGEKHFDTCVPEPATLALLGLGGLAMLRRRRK